MSAEQHREARDMEPQLSSTSPSGIDVPTSVGPDAIDPARIGAPGEYPYTRGIFPDGYQGRLWTIRQYSGFGTAEESNERYKFLLEKGQTGLSVALDLPTQCGLDPVHPMARPEIGKVGVSLSNLSEAEILFKDLDLSKISTSFTINGTAAIIYAMYLAVADKQNVPRDKLTGTIQNDILKEYVARGTWIFPVRPSMRLIADSILYSNEVSPRFNPISIAGAHVRDAGSTAAEEMAYTLANGLAYVEELRARGGDVEKFAKRLSFFFYVHMDFFDEIAKFRAGRRLWARLMKERYGVQDPKAQHFRFGVVCGGSSLVAPQPYNNVARVAVETMAAVLGGAQSIFTCAFDEAFQIPTEFSAELAVRTQQIIAFESGIGRTVDPLGGSYFLEQHTDRMEEQITKVMDEIDAYGGVIPAIEDGWIQLRLAERGLERKLNTDSGRNVIIGQNYFRKADEEIKVGEVFKLDPTVAERALEKYQRVLDTRRQSEVDRALSRLSAVAAKDNENIMPYLVECCHAYATVGEMVERLKDKWGEFKEPVNL
ncbi:methylmalonyl-CoA mutase N-terminal domain protein [Achromobacter xylosoxidans A8]|uniref:Methylmalonyl-CoA mutase N-terminal domain protein n=1 Tax=Achromobacter xylosoxidans (strain A8) TaxID=762376 RepID=E3HLP7_ACHXA|nr:methylmalonyl-CoA mutase family protein [Achromobacter xylosoxidans]ADP19382.1 methylmalonyl-CoA mutase N-terminal domain protein [Achromobacter xylosoxidans A8]